jgi:hypothetical protein
MVLGAESDYTGNIKELFDSLKISPEDFDNPQAMRRWLGEMIDAFKSTKSHAQTWEKDESSKKGGRSFKNGLPNMHDGVGFKEIQSLANFGLNTLYDPANWGNLDAYYPSDELLNGTDVEDTANSNNLQGPTKFNSLTDVQFGSPKPSLNPPFTYRSDNDTIYYVGDQSSVVSTVSQSDGSVTEAFDLSSVLTYELVGITWDSSNNWFWIIDNDTTNNNSYIYPVDDTGAQQGSPVTFDADNDEPIRIEHSSSRGSFFVRTSQSVYEEYNWTAGDTNPSPSSSTDLSGEPSSVLGFGTIGDELWAIHVSDPSEAIILDATSSLNEIDRFEVRSNLVQLAFTEDTTDERAFAVEYVSSSDVSLREIEFANEVSTLSTVSGVGGTQALDYSAASKSASVSVPSVIDASGLSDYSIAAWFNLNTKSGVHPVISFEASGSSILFSGYNGSQSSMFGFVNGTSAGQVQVPGPDVSTGTWLLATFVINSSSGNAELYIDNSGTPDGSASFGDSISDVSSGTIHIGGSSLQDNYLDGSIDEILFFPGKALSASEIDTLYQAGA